MKKLNTNITKGRAFTTITCYCFSKRSLLKYVYYLLYPTLATHCFSTRLSAFDPHYVDRDQCHFCDNKSEVTVQYSSINVDSIY